MFARINRLALGGIPLQRGDAASAKTLIETMSLDGYILIDSAKVYGFSESWIGLATKDNRDKYFLATKSMARDYQQMSMDIADSLEKLQTSYIDLYQCHNIFTEEDYRKVMAEGGAYQALVEAKDKGVIKHIGVTSHSIDLMMRKLDEMPFESLQVPYNVIENDAEELMNKARLKGLLTIAMKPLSGGVVEDWALALRFFNKSDAVDIVLAGMADEKEYLENKTAILQAFTSEDQEKATKLKKELGNSFCRRCGYCLPCSVGINIPMVWTCELYAKSYGLKEWAVDRYNSLAIKADSCIACGSCEASCPYQLKISAKMKEVAQFFAQ